MTTGYRFQDGTPLTLGEKLGQGGEGTVYQAMGTRDTAVKIWNDQTDRSQAGAKIMVMLENPPARNGPGPETEAQEDTAWPKAMVLDERGKPAGFTMPLLGRRRYTSVFNYFNPAARADTGRKPGTADMLAVAKNLAEATAGIHRAGYVIGDVNEKNVMVASDNRVVLVDTDSMQVKDPTTGVTHRCTKGRDDYTPPRMQGLRFRDHDRTPDDDNFGAAILIFKLLMNGVHPYASTSDPDVAQDVPLAEKIKREYFPYNESGHTPREHQPSIPYQEAWQDLDFNLRHLFRRAFDPDATQQGTRPTPEEWSRELETSIANPRRPRKKAEVRKKSSPNQGSGARRKTPAGSSAARINHFIPPSWQTFGQKRASQVYAGGTGPTAQPVPPTRNRTRNERMTGAAIMVVSAGATMGVMTLIRMGLT